MTRNSLKCNVFLVLFVLSLPLGVVAQQPRLQVEVAPPEGGGPMSRMQTDVLRSHLTKADLDLIESIGQADLDSMMSGGLGNPPAGPSLETDLTIHFKVGALKNGKITAVAWATELASGDKVVEVEASAGAKSRQDRQAAMRALDLAAGKLVEGLGSYRRRLVEQGRPMRIELRGAPPAVLTRLPTLLENKSTKVQAKPAGPGVSAWLIRTKTDCLDLAVAIDDLIADAAPTADCDFKHKYGRLIILACKP